MFSCLSLNFDGRVILTPEREFESASSVSVVLIIYKVVTLANWVNRNGLLLIWFVEKNRYRAAKVKIVLSKDMEYLNLQFPSFMLPTSTKYTSFDRRFKSFKQLCFLIFFPYRNLMFTYSNKNCSPSWGGDEESR